MTTSEIKLTGLAHSCLLARREVMDCVTSLSKAIHIAGGNFSADMLDLSVQEFIVTIAAQNHIRFVYETQRVRAVEDELSQASRQPSSPADDPII